MQKNIKIDSVIVTFNRLNLLKECISAVLNQSYKVENIFVIDNNSTDNTWNYLKKMQTQDERIQPIHLNQNIGGAGGFNQGMKAFIEKSNSDYVWIMDDDTIPDKDALKRFVESIDIVKKFGFLASNVRFKDGNTAIMNIPGTSGVWNEYANKELIGIKFASFVSLIFPRYVVEKVGYPITDFFIWGDDYEYTTRVTRAGFNNYFVANSLVVHKIKNNIGADIFLEKEKNRVNRYYFDARNRMYTVRKTEGKKNSLKLFLKQGLIIPVKLLFSSSSYKGYKAWIEMKGTFVGVFFNPKVERPQQKE